MYLSKVEFKKIITDCMNSKLDLSSFLNQMKIKRVVEIMDVLVGQFSVSVLF